MPIFLHYLITAFRYGDLTLSRLVAAGCGDGGHLQLLGSAKHHALISVYAGSCGGVDACHQFVVNRPFHREGAVIRLHRSGERVAFTILQIQLGSGQNQTGAGNIFADAADDHRAAGAVLSAEGNDSAGTVANGGHHTVIYCGHVLLHAVPGNRIRAALRGHRCGEGKLGIPVALGSGKIRKALIQRNAGALGAAVTGRGFAGAAAAGGIIAGGGFRRSD